MIKSIFKISIPVISIIFSIFLSGCDVFESDKTADDMLITGGGYFYLIEKQSNSLIMMDTKLQALKKWSLNPVSPDSSTQGIAFDGKYIWVAVSGSIDMIYQLDISGDSVSAVKGFPAPPDKKATIRGITYDGTNLWAINSGNISPKFDTSSVAANLYKLDNTGKVVFQQVLPFTEPRGITFVNSRPDAYGNTIEKGIYISDTRSLKVYKFIFGKWFIDTAFSAPIPPRGKSYASPLGLTFDGDQFWLINGNQYSNADHLYRIKSNGKEQERYDLNLIYPGSIVYANFDARIGLPPSVLEVLPNSGLAGSIINVTIYGSNFKNGSGLKVNFGSGITVSNLSYLNPTQLKVDLNIASNATIGKRSVLVTNPDGLSSAGDSLFEVKNVITIPYLYLAEQDTGYVFKIKLSDTSIVKQWDTKTVCASNPQGLAFDGTNYWMSVSGTDRKIFRINTTGNTLTSDFSINVPTSSGTVRGIVSEGSNIWLCMSNPSKVFKLNSGNGAVLDSMNAPGKEPRGLVIANGVLYCNDTDVDSVFAWNNITKQWGSVFATPVHGSGSKFATGMTFDGTNFWIANSSGSYDHIYKVTPSGIILFQFDAPRIGTAQVTGIVYTEN